MDDGLVGDVDHVQRQLELPRQIDIGGRVQVRRALDVFADVAVAAIAPAIARPRCQGAAHSPVIGIVIERRVGREFRQRRQGQADRYPRVKHVARSPGEGHVAEHAELVERRGQEVEVALRRDLDALDRRAWPVDRTGVVHQYGGADAGGQQRGGVSRGVVGDEPRLRGDVRVHLLVEGAYRQRAALPVIIFQRGLDGVRLEGREVGVAGSDRAAERGEVKRARRAHVVQRGAAQIAVAAQAEDQRPADIER